MDASGYFTPVFEVPRRIERTNERTFFFNELYYYNELVEGGRRRLTSLVDKIYLPATSLGSCIFGSLFAARPGFGHGPQILPDDKSRQFNDR